VPADEQAKIAGGNTARVDRFDVATLIVPAEDNNSELRGKPVAVGAEAAQRRRRLHCRSWCG
jgi:hypothetical protein